METENCKNLTVLIYQLRNELRTYNFFVDGKQYDRAKVQIRVINRYVKEKSEFFRWRKFAKFFDRGGYESESTAEKFHQGFWPVKVSPDGEMLYAIRRLDDTVEDDQTVDIINLKNEAETLADASIRKERIPTYFAIDPEGTIFIRTERKGMAKILYRKAGQQGSSYDAADPQTLPDIFAVGTDIAVGASDNDGTICSIGAGFKKGERFKKPSFIEIRRFKDIEFSANQEIIYSLDTSRQLTVWNHEKKECLYQSMGVIDFKPLENTNYIVLSGKGLEIQKPNKQDGEYISSYEVRSIIKLENGEANPYEKIAVDPKKEYVFALAFGGLIDIFNLKSMEKVGSIDFSSEIDHVKIKSFDIGIDHKIIFGLVDGRILIFRNTAKKKVK